MKKNKLVSRMIQMCVVLIGISFLTFLLTYLAPGDPATAMYDSLGVTPSPEMLEQARASMGLDKPFLQQYVDWLGGIFHGDFGTSFSKSVPVLELLTKRLPATFRLALFSLGLMLVISLPLGISLPGFLIGLILLYVFALKLGMVKVASSTVGIEQMLLPGITLAIAMASKYSRQVRTAVLEELHQDYVTGARARGMNQWEILFRQVLPNAMLPLITMLGLSFGSLLGGTAVVEIIFSYPGLGILAVGAVKARDYPLIQGFVLWIALIYMVVNLLVDISYHYIDPRTREGED